MITKHRQIVLLLLCVKKTTLLLIFGKLQVPFFSFSRNTKDVLQNHLETLYTDI